MRRTVLLLLSMAVALLFASGAVLALLLERPDDTDGRQGVRAIEQVGTNIWLGGRFSRVKQRNGTVLGSGQRGGLRLQDGRVQKGRKATTLGARIPRCLI